MKICLKNYGEIMNNLEERIKEIEKQLEELKVQLTEEDKEDKYKRKRFDYDKYYWFVDTFGEVCDTPECYASEDNFLFEIGNYFETEEQAENYKEKLLIEQELKDIAMELNKGKDIDWDNDRQDKFCISYNKTFSSGLTYEIYYNTKIQGVVYCLDKNFKYIAIKRIGKERLTRYLKGELD